MNPSSPRCTSQTTTAQLGEQETWLQKHLANLLLLNCCGNFNKLPLHSHPVQETQWKIKVPFLHINRAGKGAEKCIWDIKFKSQLVWTTTILELMSVAPGPYFQKSLEGHLKVLVRETKFSYQCSSHSSEKKIMLLRVKIVSLLCEKKGHRKMKNLPWYPWLSRHVYAHIALMMVGTICMYDYRTKDSGQLA